MSMLLAGAMMASSVVASVPTDYVGAWYAEDASGTSQPDRSANGNDGTATGATLGTNEWQFDGNDDRIAFGDVLDSVFATANQKISFSVRFNATSGGPAGQVLIGKIGDSNQSENQRQFFIRLSSGQPEMLAYFNLTGTNRRGWNGGGADLRDDLDHELIVTYDGSLDTNDGLDRVEMYLDGSQLTVSASLNNGSLGDIQNSTSQLYLGASGGTSNSVIVAELTGSIKRAMIYDRIINASERMSIESESL